MKKAVNMLNSTGLSDNLIAMLVRLFDNSDIEIQLKVIMVVSALGETAATTDILAKLFRLMVDSEQMNWVNSAINTEFFLLHRSGLRVFKRKRHQLWPIYEVKYTAELSTCNLPSD